MISAEEFKKLFDFTYEAHQLHVNGHGSTTRQKGDVPFVSHPFWCALTLLGDVTVSQEERELGFKVLMLHDVLEDTTLPLPEDTAPEVVALVKDMTYENWEQEKQEVPKKSEFIQLLKLLDKVSTIYDNINITEVMKIEKRKGWREFSELLLHNVEQKYGNSQVYRLAKGVIENSGW